VIAYVVNLRSDSVTPINVATDKPGQAITVGSFPDAIAITPDGTTAYVANRGSGTVTPIDTTTSTAGQAIKVGAGPDAIAITPDGKTAYVVNNGSGTVTPIDTTTSTAGQAIKVGAGPDAIAITPDGKTAYVVNNGSGTVTSINTATGTARTAVTVGSFPDAIAITPDGKTAYAANGGSGTVTPVNTATSKAGQSVKVGFGPGFIAIAPDGTTAYVAAGNAVTPINTATSKAGQAIPVGIGPDYIAITPDGTTAYVANQGCGCEGGTNLNTVIPINTATSTADHAISGFTGPDYIAITPDGTTAYVANGGSDTVTPVNTATSTAGPAIKVGNYPIAIAITPVAARVAPVPAGFEAASASFVSPAVGFVLGGVGCQPQRACTARLVSSTDGGGRWHFLPAPSLRLFNKAGDVLTQASRVSSVLFAGRRDGWLYGPGLWSTRDGGAHWRRISLGRAIVPALGGGVVAMAASAGTAYAVVSPDPFNGGPDELFSSPVGRNAWTRVASVTAGQGAVLAVAGRAVWFADGGGEVTHLWRTTDGVHWRQFEFRCPGPGYWLQGIAAASTSHVVLLCAGDGAAGSMGKEVLESTNGGQSVHLTGRAPLGGDPSGIAVPPGRPNVITLAAASGASFLYRSDDGGKTWAGITVPGSGGGLPLNSLSYVSRTVGWVVVGGPGSGAGRLLRTTDAGRTWHQIGF
jgi:YVTN family beta-propeller protein